MLVRTDMSAEAELAWLEREGRFDGAAELARIRNPVLDKAGRPKRKNGSPEHSVQVTLVSYLKRVMPGAIVAAVKNEHAAKSPTKAQRMRFYAKRKAEGVRKGYPDLIVDPIDQASFRVETKAPDGEVSEEQQQIHAALEARGTVVIVADAIESLRFGMLRRGIRSIEAAGQPMRPPKVYYEGIPAAEARKRGLIA